MAPDTGTFTRERSWEVTSRRDSEVGCVSQEDLHRWIQLQVQRILNAPLRDKDLRI